MLTAAFRDRGASEQIPANILEGNFPPTCENEELLKTLLMLHLILNHLSHVGSHQLPNEATSQGTRLKERLSDSYWKCSLSWKRLW